MTLGLLMLAIVSALASAILLALSQERNWRIAYGPGAGRRDRMRRIGWPFALLTFALCIARDGASFGTMLGLFMLAAVFVTVTLMLAFRPRWLRPVALPFALGSE
ncbi:MAG: DUF3325 domain-containing protein [Sphingobium sp.]